MAARAIRRNRGHAGYDAERGASAKSLKNAEGRDGGGHRGDGSHQELWGPGRGRRDLIPWRSGEIFGILGPNGAGKTTAVECMEGLRRRDSGQVRVLGMDPRTDGHRLHQRIGVQLQQTQLQDKIKVREALDMYASFYPDPADWRELLKRWGLASQSGRRFAKLSGGQKQRLFIALALVGNPELVFLDALTSGLDPGARRATWELIRQVRDGGVTVVLVSHFMDEVEELCDRVAILERGRIAALDTPAGLVTPGPSTGCGSGRWRRWTSRR